MLKRALVILGIVLLVVVVGTVIAGGVLFSRVDARAELEKRVTEATGRRFVVGGPVSVTFWPAIGFKVKDVALANAPGGSAANMLTAKEMVIGVAVRPLIDRKVEVKEFTLREPQIALEVNAAGQPNWVFPETKKDASKGGSLEDLKEFSLQDVRIDDGTLSYASLASKTVYTAQDIDLKAEMKGLDQPLTVEGDMTYNQERAHMKAELSRFRALLTGAATPMTFALEGKPLKVGLVGTFDAKTGDMGGDLSAAGSSLRNLAAWAGTPLGAGPGFGPFDVKGKLDIGPKKLMFSNASIALDSIKGRGDFEIVTARARPYLSGRLELASLDLNTYLAAPAPAPPAGATPAPTAPAGGPATINVQAPGWSKAKIDMAGLKTVDMDLDLTTGPLRFLNYKIDGAKLGLVLNDGFLAATLSDLRFYGGVGTGRVEIDARGPSVNVRNVLAAQNVNAMAFFTDAMNFKNLEGAAKIDWDLRASGESQDALMHSVVGDGKLALNNGALRGVNLGGLSKTIKDAIMGGMIGPNARTPFTSFAGTFKAQKGVFATQDFLIQGADVTIKAAGVIDMGAQSMDMRITPRSASVFSHLGFKGAGVSAPFLVRGPWSKLTYAPDLTGSARAEVEGRAKSVIGGETKAGGVLGQILGGGR